MDDKQDLGSLNKNPESAPELQNVILREQVRLVMKQLPTMQAASYIVALVLGYTVRDIVPRTMISTWLFLVMLIVISRIVLALRFQKVRDSDFTAASWENAYSIMALVSGIIWGCSAFMIFPTGHTGLISLFVLAMASLAAATTVSHASLRSGPSLWMMPVLLFYAVRCFAELKEPETTIAVLIVVYLIALLRHAYVHHLVIRSAISFKFENRRLLQEVREANETLKRISALDGLTGLANRRKFDEFMEREWRRAGRNKRPIAVILIDIDHFKAYNDNYGHQAGDTCLRKVAKVIQDSLRRPADFVARYGGEEFVVVMPETDGPGAVQVAERLRSEVEKLGETHAFSSTAGVVTISAGSSAITPKDGDKSADLFGVVDKALYTAKTEGRNRVKAA